MLLKVGQQFSCRHSFSSCQMAQTMHAVPEMLNRASIQIEHLLESDAGMLA
jgi:hypothetical protein